MTEFTTRQYVEDILRRAADLADARASWPPGVVWKELLGIREVAHGLGGHADAAPHERGLAEWAIKNIPLGSTFDNVGGYQGAAKVAGKLVELARQALEADR